MQASNIFSNVANTGDALYANLAATSNTGTPVSLQATQKPDIPVSNPTSGPAITGSDN